MQCLDADTGLVMGSLGLLQGHLAVPSREGLQAATGAGVTQKVSRASLPVSTGLCTWTPDA